jgi:hypothetical protein
VLPLRQIKQQKSCILEFTALKNTDRETCGTSEKYISVTTGRAKGCFGNIYWKKISDNLNQVFSLHHAVSNENAGDRGY